jgi:hypothetical protein
VSHGLGVTGLTLQLPRNRFDEAFDAFVALLDEAKAHGAAQNQELKTLIERARPVIEKHLDRAEELQKKLGKPTA